MTRFSLLAVNSCFGGPFRLLNQGKEKTNKNLAQAGNRQKQKQQHIPLKRRFTFNELHDIIFKNMEMSSTKCR
jgi:hypothetical protein